MLASPVCSRTVTRPSASAERITSITCSSVISALLCISQPARVYASSAGFTRLPA